jgi:hypothetical protein
VGRLHFFEENVVPKEKPAEAEAPVADAAPAAEAEAPAAPEAAAAEVPEAPLHLAFLDHDDTDASASVAGVLVVRGDNGLYLVPLTLVPDLLPHGFRVVSEGR